MAGMAEAYYALALAKTESNETQDEAIQYFNKALDINNKLKNKEAISSIHNELGNIFMTLDQLEDATKHFKKALDLYKKLDDIEGMASTFVNIAELYEIQEDYRNAGFNFLKAAEQFIECGLPDLAEEFIARTDSLIQELPKSTRRTVRKKIDELNAKMK
jgi:tetratricopeptide (TPR) repeat protein